MFHLEQNFSGRRCGERVKHVCKNSLIFIIIDYLTHVAKMDRFVVRRPRTAVEELASQTTNQPLTDSVATAELPPLSDSLEHVEATAKRSCLCQPSSADVVNVKMQWYIVQTKLEVQPQIGSKVGVDAV